MNSDMSWKMQEQYLNWKKIHENFWIKSLNFYHVVFFGDAKFGEDTYKC